MPGLSTEPGRMRGRRTVMILTAVGIFSGAILCAGERGTADEAKTLLTKAVSHYKQVGRTQALQDFTGRKPLWVDRDLYVACVDSKSVVLANGAFPMFVGTSVDTTKDAQGRPLGRSFWEAASKGGIQSVEWRWYNPVTGKLERKISLVEKVDDDVICTVGYYRPE